MVLGYRWSCGHQFSQRVDMWIQHLPCYAGFSRAVSLNLLHLLRTIRSVTFLCYLHLFVPFVPFPSVAGDGRSVCSHVLLFEIALCWRVAKFSCTSCSYLQKSLISSGWCYADPSCFRLLHLVCPSLLTFSSPPFTGATKPSCSCASLLRSPMAP